MGKRKTDEEFKKEYYNKFPDTNVKILGKYEAMKKPIECICKKCNYEWSPSPNGIFNGSGCPKCSGTLKYTTESFKQAYYNKFPESNIEIIGDYVNTKTKIDCICKKCGYNWTPTPNKLLMGRKCPKCKVHKKYETETFLKLFHDQYSNSNVDIIGNYVNSKTPIKCVCKICNYKWNVKPNRLMDNHNCPQCFKKTKYTTESYKEAYYNKFPDSNIEIIGDYISSNTPIKCKCKICNYEWEPKASHLLNKGSCAGCAGNAKYTEESFRKKYSEKFPNSKVMITGKFVDLHTAVSCKCKDCGYEWNTSPQKLLSGSGCRSCRNNKYNTESFKEAYYKRFPNSNVLIVGKYTNSRTKIECQCKVCNWKWFTTPNSLMNGYGCHKCSGKMQYTTESFKEDYYKKHPDSNIEIIGEYINGQTSIKCKCRVCGYEWTAMPQNLHKGSNCIACVGKAKYNTESFKEKFYENFPDTTIEILGKYTGARAEIECKCNVCGYSWKPRAGNLLRGNGANCPYCYGTIKNYTTELFIKKINEKYPYSNVIIKGKYKNTKERITAECAICHKQWNPLAEDLMTGKGCPYCAINKTEKSLGTFLDNLGISYTPQKKFKDCKYKKELPFDYEINDKRFTAFLLEYQGEQHDHPVDFSGKNMARAEKEFEIIKKRDKIKYDYCKMTGRHLKYIWYYEEDKIQALINLLRKYIKPEYNLDKILANAKMNKTA